MKLNDFLQKVKEIAGERHCTASVKLSLFPNGTMRVEWTAYVANNFPQIVSGDNPDELLDLLAGKDKSAMPDEDEELPDGSEGSK